MQVQVSGIYTHTCTEELQQIYALGSPPLHPAYLHTHYRHSTHSYYSLLALNLSLLISLLPLPFAFPTVTPNNFTFLLWISFCLPEISSWPQSTAFCEGLLQLIFEHGTTYDRKGDIFNLEKIKTDIFKFTDTTIRHNIKTNAQCLLK